MKTLFVVAFWLAALYFVFQNLNYWNEKGEVGFGGFISILTLISFAIFLVLSALTSFGAISKQLRRKIYLLFVSGFITLTISEIVLRCFAERFRCYSERNGSHYYTTLFHTFLQRCDSCGGGYFYTNPPNSTDPFIKPEFQYPHHYNSLGLRDTEFSTAKDTNEYRILATGDSFTEGVGAPSDSTWVKQLANRLNAVSSGTRYTTMNSGVHGSDLFFSYDLLIHCLLKYRPDLVILDLNSTDINDIIWRGDYDRFDAQGNFVGRNGPWWEYIFGSSYIARLIILNVLHYNWGLLSYSQEQRAEARTLVAISQKINEYEQLSRKEHFKFLLVLQPLKEELARQDAFASLRVDSPVAAINLYPVFERKIVAQHEPESKYYWPVDGHFKSPGYGVMAEEIYRHYFLEKGSAGK